MHHSGSSSRWPRAARATTPVVLVVAVLLLLLLLGQSAWAAGYVPSRHMLRQAAALSRTALATTDAAARGTGAEQQDVATAAAAAAAAGGGGSRAQSQPAQQQLEGHERQEAQQSKQHPRQHQQQQQPRAAALSPAADAAVSQPYDLAQLPDLPALLAAHQKWQERVLSERHSGVPAVKVETGVGHGLGNRVPGIITGFALALLTGRLFLLQSTVHEHWQLPLPCVWQEYESLYEGVDRCNIGHFTKLINPGLEFCGGPGDDRTAPLLMQPCQFDYMLPMLQINPALAPAFAKFFPDGEVFHPLAAHLLRTPRPVLAAALAPYAPLSAACAVGMHLRTKKQGTSAKPEQFAAIARALLPRATRSQHGGGGNVFVAADEAAAAPAVRAALRAAGVTVWASNSSAAELAAGARTHAGNPGSELGAALDLMLLSACESVILTPASSLGALAAGLAGVRPVYATHGAHTHPFTNPWFWQSMSSEPCFVKAAELHTARGAIAAQFRAEHPLFVHHSQCHFEHASLGLPAPTWQCTPQACREW